jgi:putative ABC transport system permease protein
MLACFLPARAAAKISPVEAMRGAEPGGGERFPLMVVVVASGCWLLATTVIVLSVTGWLPSVTSIPAGVLMMLGFVLMVPPILEPLARGISRYALQWFWPAESVVASRQVFRNPRRATLATAVMIVALGDSIGMGHALVNTVADVRNWYHRALRADVILLPTDPQTAAELGLKAHAPVEDRLREIDGVEQIETLRMANVRVGDLPAMLVARSFSQGQPLPWSIPDADADRVSTAFEEGAAVVGSVLAGNAGLAVGDRLRVEHAGQVATLPVAAIVTDYHAGGQTVYLRREIALAELGVDGIDLFLLKLSDQNRVQTEEQLRTFCATNSLTLRSFQELRDFLEGIMNGVVVAFWCVLTLGLVVASFGTINTLSMNILEQTREIGLLRIIGMTRRQVRRTVLSQTLILGLVGALLGTVAGVTTAYVIDLCIGGVLLRPTVFQWRPAVILGCNALALLLLVPATLIPAWRATHMNIWGALEYE